MGRNQLTFDDKLDFLARFARKYFGVVSLKLLIGKVQFLRPAVHIAENYSLRELLNRR